MKKSKVTAKSVHRHTIAIPMQKELLALREQAKALTGSMHFALAIHFDVATTNGNLSQEIKRCGQLKFSTERKARTAARYYSKLDGVNAVRITKHYVSDAGTYQAGKKL